VDKVVFVCSVASSIQQLTKLKEFAAFSDNMNNLNLIQQIISKAAPITHIQLPMVVHAPQLVTIMMEF
jgi:hypothetical protein